jgi:hypothetical protein
VSLYTKLKAALKGISYTTVTEQMAQLEHKISGTQCMTVGWRVKIKYITLKIPNSVA